MSQRPRSSTAVTMIVSQSVGRLAMLPGMCTSWGAVVSLALYVPVVAGDPGRATVIQSATAAAKHDFDW